MRSIFPLLLVLVIAHSATAQTQKGSFLIGGALTGSLTKTTFDQNVTGKTSSISMSPKTGFFVFDNFCAGVSIPLSFARTKFDYGNNSPDEPARDASSWGLGPFVRYYFPINKLQIIAEAGYTWSTAKTVGGVFDPSIGAVVNLEVETKTSSFLGATGLGIILSKSATIEFLLNYQKTNSDIDYKYGSDSEQSEFFFSVGFQVYIPKKTAE